MTSCSLSRSEGIFVCIEAWFNYLNCVKTTENIVILISIDDLDDLFSLYTLCK